MLTKEELFRKRYRVIAKDTSEKFKIGDIVHHPPEWIDYIWKVNNYIVYNPENYPHLFQELKWWEERKPEEMPEYISYYDTSMYFPVGPYICKTADAPFSSHGYTADFIQPATKQDYDNYIDKKNSL